MEEWSERTAVETTAEAPADGLEAALAQLQDQLKALRDAAGRVMRAHDGRDLTALRARVPALPEILEATRRAVDDAQAALTATPAGTALGSDYPERLEAEFGRLGVPFEGAFPEYQVFPFTVRVNVEGESVRIGRRTLSTLAPAAVALAVQKEHRRLHGSSFNATRFLEALSRCYDALSGRELGAPVPLVAIYRLLSARTGTAGYTLPEFAFDIYRLRRSSELVVKDRTLEFTHGKTGTTIAVPRSQGGAELFTALVMRKDAGGV